MIGKTRQANVEPPAPRGVLHPQLAQGRFHHEHCLPPAPLADLVDCFWHVHWDLRGLPPQQQATLPHPNVHLVVERSEARIYGVQTDRFDRRLEGRDFAFGVKFRPGAFQPFLGAPVATLANRSLPLEAVFGPHAGSFAARIAACPSLDAMAAEAAGFVLQHRPPPDPNVARAGMLVSTIAADLAITSVDALTAAAAIDKRTLQRLFQKYVGIGPKWVIRRYRLHEAIARIQAGVPVDWAAFALALGYFDQAHFGRDFRALVGQSPAGYARGTLGG